MDSCCVCGTRGDVVVDIPFVLYSMFVIVSEMCNVLVVGMRSCTP